MNKSLEYEFNADKFLKEAEKNIHEAIKSKNIVWIELSNGKSIKLDANSKIQYVKLYKNIVG